MIWRKKNTHFFSVPEEFLYDPVSKSYGDPSRRPECKSATIEFIAPSEYMLRPPQVSFFREIIFFKEKLKKKSFSACCLCLLFGCLTCGRCHRIFKSVLWYIVRWIRKIARRFKNANWFHYIWQSGTFLFHVWWSNSANSIGKWNCTVGSNLGSGDWTQIGQWILDPILAVYIVFYSQCGNVKIFLSIRFYVKSMYFGGSRSYKTTVFCTFWSLNFTK